jgi:anti-sigma regulatory factor (Ser/Thr protein kinase)
MVSFTTAATNSGVHAVRGQLVKELTGAGVVLSDEEGFTLGLLVSEVATNGLVHGVGAEDPKQFLTVEADMVRGAGRLRVAVLDPGLGLPELKLVDDKAEHGRGLFLVAALAVAHGHERVGLSGGKRVWFELEVGAREFSASSAVEQEPGPCRSSRQVEAPVLLPASARTTVLAVASPMNRRSRATSEQGRPVSLARWSPRCLGRNT